MKEQGLKLKKRFFYLGAEERVFIERFYQHNVGSPRAWGKRGVRGLFIGKILGF